MGTLFGEAKFINISSSSAKSARAVPSSCYLELTVLFIWAPLGLGHVVALCHSVCPLQNDPIHGL